MPLINSAEWIAVPVSGTTGDGNQKHMGWYLNLSGDDRVWTFSTQDAAQKWLTERGLNGFIARVHTFVK
jgi:hypothetical protein